MNKPKLYLAFVICITSLVFTRGTALSMKISQDSSIHKFWRWQSFKSLTRASINIQKFDLDLSSADTLIFHLTGEEITSMRSTVDDSSIQKTRTTKEPEPSELIKSSYQIIDNVLIINDERFKNKITYKIKSVSAEELVLIMHFKIKSEDRGIIEGDAGEITFKIKS